MLCSTSVCCITLCTVYDPAYGNTASERPNAVAAEFGMSEEETIEIIRLLSDKFIARRPNVKLTFDMGKAGKTKEGSVSTHTYWLRPMSTLLLSSVPNFPASGEMVCLELAYLLGYYQGTGWNDVKADKWNYRALVMTRVIMFLYKEDGSRYLAGTQLDSVSDWSKDLATDEETLRFKTLVKQKVLQDLFQQHETVKAIYEAASDFYGPWPEEVCSLCMEEVWDQKSLVMTRGCCGNRFHAICLYDRMDQERRLIDCNCAMAANTSNDYFLVLDRFREVRGAVRYGGFNDRKQFVDDVNLYISKTPSDGFFDGSDGYGYLDNFDSEDSPPEVRRFQQDGESRRKELPPTGLPVEYLQDASLTDPNVASRPKAASSLQANEGASHARDVDPLISEECCDNLKTTMGPWDTIQWKTLQCIDIVERTKKYGLSTLSEEDAKSLRKRFDSNNSCFIMRGFSDTASFDFNKLAACEDFKKFQIEQFQETAESFHVQRFDIDDNGSISSQRVKYPILFVEFNRYLIARKEYLTRLPTGDLEVDDEFFWLLGFNPKVRGLFQEEKIHLGKTILYLLDVNLRESWFDAFWQGYFNGFCYNGFFPRGKDCLLQWVSQKCIIGTFCEPF